VIPPRGSRDSRKPVAVNKRHPYRDLEREYITSDISIRELRRRHGIRSHSVVVDQSQKHDWAAKREAYRARCAFHGNRSVSPGFSITPIGGRLAADARVVFSP
jgi:hypothetical protein